MRDYPKQLNQRVHVFMIFSHVDTLRMFKEKRTLNRNGEIVIHFYSGINTVDKREIAAIRKKVASKKMVVVFDLLSGETSKDHEKMIKPIKPAVHYIKGIVVTREQMPTSDQKKERSVDSICHDVAFLFNREMDELLRRKENKKVA